MKPMPWANRPSPLLSDRQVHVDQLVRLNQPDTLRSALAGARHSVRGLIRGSRGACVKDRRYWREVVDILHAYRHNAQVYIEALNRLGEPTSAQRLAMH